MNEWEKRTAKNLYWFEFRDRERTGSSIFLSSTPGLFGEIQYGGLNLMCGVKP